MPDFHKTTHTNPCKIGFICFSVIIYFPFSSYYKTKQNIEPNNSYRLWESKHYIVCKMKGWINSCGQNLV